MWRSESVVGYGCCVIRAAEEAFLIVRIVDMEIMKPDRIKDPP